MLDAQLKTFLDSRTMKITKSHDANGNCVAKIKVEGHRAFSIQTNGNLPRIHREFTWECENHSHNETEVKNFVREHGTKRQKEICGIA